MIIIDLGCEIYDVRYAFCDLEGYDRFVIASCRTRSSSRFWLFDNSSIPLELSSTSFEPSFVGRFCRNDQVDGKFLLLFCNIYIYLADMFLHSRLKSLYWMPPRMQANLGQENFGSRACFQNISVDDTEISQYLSCHFSPVIQRVDTYFCPLGFIIVADISSIGKDFYSLRSYKSPSSSLWHTVSRLRVEIMFYWRE